MVKVKVCVVDPVERIDVLPVVRCCRTYCQSAVTLRIRSVPGIIGTDDGVNGSS